MKTAFITGGGRGVGRGFAEYLHDRGWRVIIGVRDPARVPTELASQSNLHSVALDVTSDDSIHVARLEVEKITSVVDLLVNNAGLNKDTATDGHKEQVCKLPSLSREKLRMMFDANTIAPIMIVKEFMPLLTTDPSFVINISSCRASYHDEYVATNANYGYRASKTALNMMTCASVRDLPANVRTFSVHPGGVRTDMNPTGEHDPYTQAGKIINITENWDDEYNGKFLRFDGTVYPL